MTILDTASTVARKSALAYVGALALSGDVARDTFAQLAERGASAEQTARAELRRLTRMVHRHSFLSGVPNFSPVDASAPDLTRYPRFRDAPLMIAHLEPGDLFYIPSFWWHQGHSSETSMSLSLWWTRGAMVPVARAAELFMRVRGIRI